MNRISSPPVIVAVLVLLLVGAVAFSWLWQRDGRVTATAIVILFLPVALLIACITLWGNNRTQIGIIAWVLTMFGALVPAVYVMQSAPNIWLAQWRFIAIFAVTYCAALASYFLWLTGWIAWVPAAPGAAPIPEYRLKQRIRSLAAAGLDVRIETPPGQPDRLFVSRNFRDGRRSIEIRLIFVSGTQGNHCVLAREVSLIRGDKPMNSSEARMSSSLRSRDATHPDADAIYDASLTLTPPNEAVRRSLGVGISDDHVENMGANKVATNPANLPHVLTELVHQSGWGWQGVFFNWQRSCR